MVSTDLARGAGAGAGQGGGGEPAGRDPRPALSLAVTLFATLNERAVRYCHWKSTASLAAALGGETDLDLLIDRADSRAFKEVLDDLDFKPVVSASSDQPLSIQHYLGFDRETGRLLHLHVYYRLVLGDRYVKYYELPVERSFLDRTLQRDGVRVPRPEVELIVLVLRALLKYRDRDIVRDLLRIGRRQRLPRRMLDELAHLLAETETGRVAQVVRSEFGFLTPELVLEALAALTRSDRPGWTFYRLRRQARRRLAPYARRGWRWARATYFTRMVAHEWPLRRLTGRLWDGEGRAKRFLSGGLTLAFVGADGAGKSTVVELLARWLSWKLEVRRYYLGSNQPSPTTRGLKAASRLATLGYAGCRRWFGPGSPLTRLADCPRRLTLYLYLLGQARDRSARYAAGRRRAALGSIVLYDRYPLSSPRAGDRAMDGPRIASLHGERPGPLAAWAARLERRCYGQIRPPHHLFALQVDPETAHQRKPDHNRAILEAKSLAVERIAADGLDLTRIDANQPLDRVMLQIKSALWSLV